MNRRAIGVRTPASALFRPWLLAVVLTAPVGCTDSVLRPQKADETERDRYEVPTVGDVTTVGNAEATPLGGIGLVVGLDGTGGETPPEYRSMFEQELRKMGIRNIPEIMESLKEPDSAIVMVTAVLPPGSRKGEMIDVEVALAPKSRATSLRGGYLKECVLYNYDFTRNLNPNTQMPQMTLRGAAVARAEGPVLVGFGAGEEPQRVKRGRVWAGAALKLDWPLTLVMNPDHQTATWASRVADRVNDTFDSGLRGAGGTPVANAHDPMFVPLRVPAQYRLNHPHYLRVVRAIPLYPNVADCPDDRPDSRSYRRRLTDDLLDPARTLSAALRLEALGTSSIPALKTGLASDHLLVRFASAQALAYLNSPAAAAELTRMVTSEPMLRAFALTALASLDESVAESRLQDILTTSESDETRYGAFRALRARNEDNAMVQGDFLNRSFWLHRVAPRAVPLIHISSSRRAEIVLFGEEPMLRAPFSFQFGDFVATAAEGADSCVVSRYPAHGAPEKRPCQTLRVAEVLHAIAELGGTYPEAIDLLDQADHCKCLSCRVAYDALPVGTTVFELDDAGKGKSDLLNAGPELEAVPTLFDTGKRRRPAQLSPQGVGE